MFKIYDIKIKNILSDNNPKTDWKRTLKYHKLMISVIQHERLIHLLVTIFVGTVTSMAFFATILSKTLLLLLLDIPLILLFIGYLFHYRFLENTVLYWYQLTDKISEKNES